MLLAALLFSAVVQTNPGIDATEPPSLYQAIVKKRDDRNGYEAFLLAIDMLKDRDFRGYVAKAPDRKESYLQFRKSLADRYSGTLSLIRLGLGKQIWDPRKVEEPRKIYPELAWLDDVDSLFFAESYARAAIGNNRGSIQSLTESFEFVSSIQRSGYLTSYLAGIDAKEKNFDELIGGMQRCGIPELLDIERWAKGKLANVNDLLASRNAEQAYIEAQFINVVEGRWKKQGGTSRSYWEEVGQLKGDEQISVQGVTLKFLKDMNDQWDRILKGDEDGWVLPSHSDYPGWTRRILDVYEKEFSDCVNGLAVERAKLRMLCLASRAYQYRWAFDKMPARVEDFSDADTARDPLNGGIYIYKPGTERNMVMYSEGSKHVPKIYLVGESKTPTK